MNMDETKKGRPIVRAMAALFATAALVFTIGLAQSNMQQAQAAEADSAEQGIVLSEQGVTIGGVDLDEVKAKAEAFIEDLKVKAADFVDQAKQTYESLSGSIAEGVDSEAIKAQAEQYIAELQSKVESALADKKEMLDAVTAECNACLDELKATENADDAVKVVCDHMANILDIVGADGSTVDAAEIADKVKAAIQEFFANLQAKADPAIDGAVVKVQEVLDGAKTAATEAYDRAMIAAKDAYDSLIAEAEKKYADDPDALAKAKADAQEAYDTVTTEAQKIYDAAVAKAEEIANGTIASLGELKAIVDTAAAQIQSAKTLDEIAGIIRDSSESFCTLVKDVLGDLGIDVDAIVADAQAVIEQVQTKVSECVEKVNTTVEILSEFVNATIEELKEAQTPEEVIGVLKNSGEAIVLAVGLAVLPADDFDAFNEKVVAVGDAIEAKLIEGTEAAIQAYEQAKAALNEFIENVNTAGAAAIKDITEFAELAMDWVADAAAQVKEAVDQGVEEAVAALTVFIENVKAAGEQAIENVKAFIAELEAKAAAVAEEIKAAVEQAAMDIEKAKEQAIEIVKQFVEQAKAACEENKSKIEMLDGIVKDAEIDMQGARNGAEIAKVITIATMRAGNVIAKGTDVIDLSTGTFDLVKKSSAYTGKNQKGKVQAVYWLGVELTAGKDYTVAAKKGKNVGKYAVKVAGTGYFTGSLSQDFSITQAKNSVTSKKAAATKTFKADANTKKLAATKSFRITATQAKATAKFGKVKYYKASGNSKITVDKSGKVKVQKDLKTGTYTVKVKAAVSGTSNYKAAKKVLTIKVVIK